MGVEPTTTSLEVDLAEASNHSVLPVFFHTLPRDFIFASRRTRSRKFADNRTFLELEKLIDGTFRQCDLHTKDNDLFVTRHIRVVDWWASCMKQTVAH